MTRGGCCCCSLFADNDADADSVSFASSASSWTRLLLRVWNDSVLRLSGKRFQLNSSLKSISNDATLQMEDRRSMAVATAAVCDGFVRLASIECRL